MTYNCRICGNDADWDKGHGCALGTPENERHRLTLKERDVARAELLKLQDDLLQGANREVMAEALIERLRGELAEAVALLKRHAKSTKPPTKDSPCPATVSCACCDTHLFLESLAVAPPAESTPVQRISMKEISWGGRYAVMQPSSTDPKQAACKTSGCGHPKEQHDFADDCTADDCTCAGFDPGDAPSPFGPCPMCSSPATPPDGIRERLDDHERRLAALEAKGEPGTQFCDDHGREDCGRPDDRCAYVDADGQCKYLRGNHWYVDGWHAFVASAPQPAPSGDEAKVRELIATWTMSTKPPRPEGHRMKEDAIDKMIELGIEGAVKAAYAAGKAAGAREEREHEPIWRPDCGNVEFCKICDDNELDIHDERARSGSEGT